MAVPKAMHERYEEIAGLIGPFCDERLGEEYKALCLKALEKLCRKRPSPAASRRATTWAAGIVYAVGRANWLFDKNMPIHMPAAELASAFGVSKSTASKTAAELETMLGIDQFSAEWVLPSQMELNPLIWMVEVDGYVVDARQLPLELQVECARLGLIPFVPGLPERA